MIRSRPLIALAWAVISLTVPAYAQNLTLPPDLREGAAASPEKPAPKSRGKAAKPAEARAKRTTGSSRAAESNPAQGSREPRRVLPADLDRGSDEDGGVRPTMSPSGRPGIGGRF